LAQFGDYASKFGFGKRRQAVAASKFNTQKYKIILNLQIYVSRKILKPLPQNPSNLSLFCYYFRRKFTQMENA
jgi:hypothetical protein